MQAWIRIFLEYQLAARVTKKVSTISQLRLGMQRQ